MLRNWVMNNETPKHDDRPWADIQRDYEAGTFKHIDDLCAHYGITQGALYYKVKHENWKRRRPKGEALRKRNDPLPRLKLLAQEKINELEEAARDRGAAGDAAIDKMSALLRLIERIATLQQKEKAVERSRTPSRIINDARRLELARRIEAIQRQLELERNHQPAEE
jgi:hypothetical protein